MTADETYWDAVERLFHEALERPAATRADWVRTAAGGDAALLNEVMRLLAADLEAAPLTDGFAAAADAVLHHEPDRIGHSVGPYRILDRIGAGGMGVVYRAARADVGAVVALKVLANPLSPEASRRFLDERRLLARLRHGGIAQLYDAGADDQGVPWFAMELVAGRPLLDHCRATDASIRERLALVRQVAEAVQYAHGQLVVHRDLKPSNVVVTPDGTVKLIDFGIATGLDDTDANPARLRSVTPAYAAPEQLTGEPATVRSDLYSIGVLLYQLLTDRLPYGPDGPDPGAEDAAPPSSLLVAARHDGIDLADLDAICLTALARDPADRPVSVDALLRNLDRLGGDLPLDFASPTAGYRLRKFWRRRGRETLLAGALVLGALGAGLAYTVSLARARASAEAEAARTLRIQRMLVDLLQGGDESVGPADSLRVVTLIDRGIEEAASLTREPVLQAELYETLGTVVRQLGRLDQADSLLRLSLAQREAALEPDHPDLASAQKALALLRAEQARFPEARSLANAAIALVERSPRSPPTRIAEAYEVLAEVEEHAGRYREAIAALYRAIAVGASEADTVSGLASRWYSLANNFYYAGELDSAAVLNRTVLEIWTRAYGATHPLVADVLINLGAIEQDRRQFPEAEDYYRRGAAIMESWYGPDHLRTAGAVSMLGRVALLQGQSERADSLIRRALDVRRRRLGSNHPRVGLMLNELANIAFGRGRLAESESLFVAAIGSYRGAYGGAHQYIATAESGLASIYLARQEPVRAERVSRSAIAMFQQTLAPEHLNVGIARIKLGRALVRQQRLGEGQRELETGVAIVRREAGPTAPWLKGALDDLIALADRRGDAGAAARLRTELAAAGN